MKEKGEERRWKRRANERESGREKVEEEGE
jgi:hypothetical protein